MSFILPSEIQSESSTIESIKSTIGYAWQEITGPTTQHLLFEVYLLLCLTILTASSLITLYNYSFGLDGDWHLILITFLWLGRYLFLRIICTGNITSSRNLLNGVHAFGYEIKLNLRGLRLFATRFITAGQYFDQPRAVSEADASRFWSSYGGFVIYIFAVLFSWLFAFATYTVDWILHLKSKFSQSNTTDSHGRKKSGKSDSRSSSSTKDSTSNALSGGNNASDHSQLPVTGLTSNASAPTVQALIQSSQATGAVQNLLEQYWRYTPPSHLLVACFVGFLCCYGALSLNTLVERSTQSSLTFETLRTTTQTQSANIYARGIITGNNIQTTTTERSAAALNHWMGGFAGSITKDLFAPGANSKAMSVGPFGYQPPRIFMYLMSISIWGTLVSLVTFGRVIFPIPDLISGVTPTPAGRSDQRSNSGKCKARKDFPWSERYRSVNKENRFRLHFQIIFLRMVENVFVCVYLPQTLFACRVTEHCTPAPAAWDRRWELTNEERFGATCLLYDSLPFDRTATFLIGLSVAMVTALILLAQVVILDKSALASSGLKYAAKQEQLTQSRNTNDSSRNRSAGSSGVSSKRKGKGKHNDMATSSSSSSSMGFSSSVTTSSSSSDAYLRAGHDMFQFELGHHSTSTVIVQLTKVMFFHLGILILCCFFRFFSDTNVVALCVALFACIIAAYVVPSAGQADTFEIENLSDKIRYFYEEQEKLSKEKTGT